MFNGSKETSLSLSAKGSFILRSEKELRMYNYAIGMFFVSLLLFILSHLFDSLNIKNIDFQVGNLLLNCSGAFLSLSLLTLIYRFFGEDRTVRLLIKLLEAHRISARIYDMGLIDIVAARAKFNVDLIHKDLKDSVNIFIVSENFGAIKYAKVRNLFKNFLKDRKRDIKVIISHNSSEKQKISDFRKSLPAKHQDRFKIKVSDIVTCGIYGSDTRIYVTPYLNNLAGDECPSIVCTPTDRKVSLYNVYREEFDFLWDRSEGI